MESSLTQSSENADLLGRLKHLARNLWWTWNQESQEIFQELSPRGWQDLYHNAVAVLQDISEYELNMRLQDPVFAQRVRSILKVFDAYMNRQDTWASRHAPAFAANPVAYFTAEYGFHETLPIAAGGLAFFRAIMRVPPATSDSGLSESACSIVKAIFSSR